ncbi:hypothetical protein EG240_04595 [Paenimyroides tangerinum]|uniref:Uncharacterized protein n=1 Tax=Paenimyroides tangerinum TaxID=2488728 RepID=A0A3P3W9K6_9FLAO|nr:hypothetical protein [Paenimyroides tangerinum]RRJ91842.1 hypothetical protein EG240_04595 [Paenimyroides tangerinum]
MGVLILFFQFVSLVFYYKFISSEELYTSSASDTSIFWVEGCLWYFISGINVLFIIRFIYVQILYSYKWFNQIIELVSFGVACAIVIPTIFYIRKKYLKNKNQNS